MLLRRLCTVLLFGGLVGLVPAAAQAAPVAAEQVMQPSSEVTAGYDLFHKNRDDDHYRCMYRCGKRSDRYHRDRHYRHHSRYCWYRDRWGWYQARCRGYDRHRHHDGHRHHDH